MPVRLCLEPRCREVAVYRGRCAAHAKRRDRQIGRVGRELYRTKRWANTRALQLALHPLCQCPDVGCEQIATDVDHVIALEDGGDPWSFSNLQSLAGDCHARKTRREQLNRET